MFTVYSCIYLPIPFGLQDFIISLNSIETVHTKSFKFIPKSLLLRTERISMSKEKHFLYIINTDQLNEPPKKERSPA